MATFDPNKTTKIIAPAGCGKTTRLLEILDGILEKTSPDRVIFTSFTRAAAYEARDRAMEKFGFTEEQLPFFRTLHSLCLRFLGRRDVMNFRDYINIARQIGVPITLRGTSASGPNPGGHVTKGDHLLNVYNLSRLCGQDLSDTYMAYDDHQVMSLKEVRHFAGTVDHYKQELGKIDFTDMLSEFLALRPRLNLEYVIVDETQDLCPLQWEVIGYLASLARRTYLAGDDDQCIHQYAGASPDILIDLECATEHRPQSYRVPRAVQGVANTVVGRIADRIPKELRPRDAEGKVNTQVLLEDLDLSQGSWFLLARNISLLSLFEQFLVHEGWLFSCERVSEDTQVRPDAVAATILWEKMREGEKLTGTQLYQAYRFMKTGQVVSRGAKILVETLKESDSIGLKEAVDKYGLMRGDHWEKQMTLTDTEKAYLKGVERKRPLHAQVDPSRITLSTIHGAKGREADHVAVLPDMSFKTWRAFQKDPEPEHRVWYVAVTRARESLHLLAPYTSMFYQL